MNYAIVSAVHGRPEIAEAWAAWLAQHFTGPVVVAGDDDEIRKRMFAHLGDERFRWVPYCNEPLGAKWNRAVEYALGTCGEDYVLVLGSDDFPSAGLLEWYDRVTLTDPKWACLNSLYFHSIAKRETSVLESRHSFGTGRMFRAVDFSNLFRTRGYVWEPSLGKGLDRSLLTAMGTPKEDRIVHQTDDVWCMAVKSAQQIWSYDKLKSVLSMPAVETLPASAEQFLAWLHMQPGIRPKQGLAHVRHS